MIASQGIALVYEAKAARAPDTIDVMANRPSAAPAIDAPARNLREALSTHWRLYLMEASELALFMIAACACTVWLYGAGSAWGSVVQNAWLRRLCMGLCMGLTAIAIIHSPMGKRSGAHFNPAITLAYLLLGKISWSDAAFYVLFQFLGGVAGVGIAAACFGARLAQPGVRYAVTVPGRYGVAAAFAAEFFMAFVLLGFVLYTSNRPRLAHFTSYGVGPADHDLHRAVCAGLGLQHQPRANSCLRTLRACLASGVALLRRPAYRHVCRCGALPARSRPRPHSLRKTAPRSRRSMSVSLSLPGTSASRHKRASITTRNKPYGHSL
jgi:glycerol uptake facilitator-like aquaporin